MLNFIFLHSNATMKKNDAQNPEHLLMICAVGSILLIAHLAHFICDFFKNKPSTKKTWQKKIKPEKSEILSIQTKNKKPLKNQEELSSKCLQNENTMGTKNQL